MNDDGRKKGGKKPGGKPTGKKTGRPGKSSKAAKASKDGKRPRADKPSKEGKPSFLKRLLKRDGDQKGSKAAASETQQRKKALTALERSIAEIRQLQKVGERDPERLAGLLANILAKEKAKKDEAQEKFDAMVWDIVHREEQDGDTDQTNSGGDDAQPPPGG